MGNRLGRVVRTRNEVIIYTRVRDVHYFLSCQIRDHRRDVAENWMIYFVISNKYVPQFLVEDFQFNC